MVLTIEQRLQKARTKLLLAQDAKFVFLAHLCEVQDVIDKSVETACTDGSSIRWNPEFVTGVDDAELLAVLMHELLHIGLLHNVVACQYEDHDRLNIAADLAVNSILGDMKCKLPKGALKAGEGEFVHLEHGKSMEHYYRQIQEMEDDELPDQQPGSIEAAGSEEAKNTPPGSSPAMGQAMAGEMIKAMVGEALTKAEGCGSLPRCLGAAVKAGLEQKVDYRTALKRFRNKIARGGADWTRPNRRLRAAGKSVARNRTRKVGTVLVLWDCSGSMPKATAEQCLAEIGAIFTEAIGTVHVWQHDTRIVHKDELKQGHTMPVLERKTHGGTSHVEPFQQIADSELRFDLIICLSDCQTSYPTDGPNVPTVWISDRPVESRYKPPFGELLDILI
jgi:predicted metal-dependent peptidase